jgi:hypothetical protein
VRAVECEPRAGAVDRAAPGAELRETRRIHDDAALDLLREARLFDDGPRAVNVTSAASRAGSRLPGRAARAAARRPRW